MRAMERASVERLILFGFGITLAVLLLISAIALNTAGSSGSAVIVASSVLLLAVLARLAVRIRRAIRVRLADEQALQELRQPLLKEGALKGAIFNSANFSSIATDAQGVIQIFNV
ncbi:MAG TPA: hybrid sensor histidine kinase/response regulator, partial [Oxalobacteraceae bacterium]|nr:hybrid sensor histidine kinase/response regulator [Oxalobacteraceae bacterium]